MSRRRSAVTVSSSLAPSRRCSLRVPEAARLIAGKSLLSERSRLRMSSILPVPLNSSKMIWSARDPVSTRHEAMMVSDPAFSPFRAAPKRRLGISRARESSPPVMVRPEPAYCLEALNARPMRVSESRTTTTSFPDSTRRLARSMARMERAICWSIS